MESFKEGSASRLENQARITRLALTVAIVTLAVSVGLNVLLAHKVRGVTYARRSVIADRLLKVGTIVPPITAKRLDGEQDVISYEHTSKPTVLYIFTPSCSWCARNLDNFKALRDKDMGQSRFIGLSLSEEGLQTYVTKNDLKVPVYSDLSPETLRTYRLGSTPQTIVISPEGKVLQNWPGAYVGDQKAQVEAFFQVTLPGLRSSPQSEIAGGKPGHRD